MVLNGKVSKEKGGSCCAVSGEISRLHYPPLYTSSRNTCSSKTLPVLSHPILLKHSLFLSRFMRPFQNVVARLGRRVENNANAFILYSAEKRHNTEPRPPS